MPGAEASSTFQRGENVMCEILKDYFDEESGEVWNFLYDEERHDLIAEHHNPGGCLYRDGFFREDLLRMIRWALQQRENGNPELRFPGDKEK